jgi:hypothetical protein
MEYKNCDSSVVIALGYGQDDQDSSVQFLAGAGNFSLHCQVQSGSGVHLASYPMDTRGSFLGGKAARCEADHSPQSSAEIKNAWSYTSTPPIRHHGVVLGAQGRLYLYLYLYLTLRSVESIYYN